MHIKPCCNASIFQMLPKNCSRYFFLAISGVVNTGLVDIILKTSL
jgi:hypothetical protein